MNGFGQYTPVRIALPFFFGIVFGLNTGVPFSFIWLIWIITALLASLILFSLFWITNYSLRWVPGLFAFFALFLAGSSLVISLQQNSRPSVKEEWLLERATAYICRLESSPVPNTGGYSLKARLIAAMDSLDEWQSFNQLLIVKCKPDTLYGQMRSGDIFLLRGKLSTINGPANPYAFDYKKYLQNQQIYFQVYADQGACLFLETGNALAVKRWAESTRDRFLDIFRRFGIDGQEFALAAALLFGTRDFLEDETEQEFSNAGAVHVLSVSGLHVGIMYVVADKLFFFLKRGRKSKRIHQALIILLIWIYSFISGLPSSVVRAALMFSLIAAGKMLKRHPENFNILALAALIQLWINPFEMTSMGFQLSYLAVAGIFAFYSPLNDSIGAVNRPVEWLWSVISVSLAAQLVTFPLAGYHFHMFPVYFLVTNLLVVPLAAIVTYFAVFLLVIGSMGLYLSVLSLPFDWSLRFMMDSVAIIQSWPGSVIDSIRFSLIQLSLIYVFIAGLFLVFVMKSRKFVFMLLICMFFYNGTLVYERWMNHDASYLTVYKTKGFSAIDLSTNGTTLFLIDNEPAEVKKQIDYQIKPNRISIGATILYLPEEQYDRQISLNGYFRKGPFISFMGKKLVIIDHDWPLKKPDLMPETDLVILSGNIKSSLKEMGVNLATKQVVITSTVPYFKDLTFRKECIELGIPCHSVNEKGAFVMKW